MNCSVMTVFIAKILSAWLFLILRHMNCMVYKLCNTLIFCCWDWDNWNTKHRLQFIDAYRSAISAHLIHHIECKHHRHIKLQKLHCQIQISLNICGIHDIYNAGRLLLNNKLSCHNLLTAVGRHWVNAWQIRHKRIRMISNLTIFAVNCHAWKISNVLVWTSQLIKKCCLSAVLISCKRKCQYCSLRNWMLICLLVETSAFTKTRMLCHSILFGNIFCVLFPFAIRLCHRRFIN